MAVFDWSIERYGVAYTTQNRNVRSILRSPCVHKSTNNRQMLFRIYQHFVMIDITLLSFFQRSDGAYELHHGRICILDI